MNTKVTQMIELLFRDVQPWNVRSPMVFTLPGMDTPVRLVQSRNTPSPMAVVPECSVSVASLVQLRNASLPMVRTVPGIDTPVSAAQFWNAP